MEVLTQLGSAFLDVYGLFCMWLVTSHLLVALVQRFKTKDLTTKELDHIQNLNEEEPERFDAFDKTWEENIKLLSDIRDHNRRMNYYLK